MLSAMDCWQLLLLVGKRHHTPALLAFKELAEYEQDSDHPIGWQNLNPMTHPNAKLASKGQWHKFELHDTSATSKASKAKW